MTLSLFGVVLALLATAVMAASAAIQAVRHDFDAFGATVLALATATGGGTVRDLLLGVTPVFWMTDLRYIATAVPVGLIAWFLASRMRSGGGRRDRLLQQFDAIGLALFTLAGVQAAQQAGLSAPIIVMVGCITGTVGGMIRDILCNVPPTILKEDLYATISLAGGAIYLLLVEFVPEGTAMIVSFLLMLGTRLVVLRRVRKACS